MYRILGADQKEYGPVSADVLRDWIASGRANARTVAQAEETPGWKPLADFPEFAEALTSTGSLPPVRSDPTSPPPPPPEPARTSGLAISSLVLGALGMLTCGISALAGLVLGIVALTKINASKGAVRGQGLAIAGICVSAVFLVMLPILAGMLLPALAKAKSKAQSVQCISNLKALSIGARLYASDNNETFPPDLASMATEVSNPKVLVCPSDPGIAYEYVSPGLKEQEAVSVVLFRCPLHGHEAMGDGAVLQNRGAASPSRSNPFR
jgi:hypothetical protein